MTEAISRILLDQRIRNRIIEYLETASSYEEQLQYEANVPIVHVPNEMINEWADYVDLDRDDYRGPVYSTEEKAAIIRFDGIWNQVIEETPEKMPSLETLLGSPPWEKLRIGAQEALDVFRLRGKCDENREQFQ